MTASISPIISPVIPCTVPSINAHAAESFISAPPMLLFVLRKPPAKQVVPKRLLPMSKKEAPMV